MTTNESPDPDRPAGAQRMQLRYGFNEIDAWWHISIGEHRERIRRRLRLMDTRVIRIFVFDKPVPDPVREWHLFAGYVQAVLDAGAVPMITFAKYHPPHDDPRNLRTYVERSRDVVWACLEQWGGKAVRDWYWCIWNEPNNIHVGGGLTFPHYRRIYEEVAGEIHKQLKPHLDGRKARIGGPAVDGFLPFWLDWISGLVNEVDDALVGFVSWHHYADWRPVVPSATLGVDLHGSPDARIGTENLALLIGQTPEYEARARAVARVLGGRDILNVCGELNTVVHHDHAYVGGLNQNAFGAAYYASALIHLMRGGASLEMRWTATANDDAYGLMTMDGKPMPACLAKQLVAQHVRYGDWIRFPGYRPETPDVDAVVAWGDDGRRSGVFVHTADGPRTLTIADWDEGLLACGTVLRIDAGTGERVTRETFDGAVRLSGYGVAVVTNAAMGIEEDQN
jgi:Glycosyl hydrolases family 39